MSKSANLILTNSYFNIFPLLCQQLKDKNGERSKKIVFCEDKNSLMTERWICSVLGGTFDVDVFSFGGFLRKNLRKDNLLSKEGSSMVIKKLLLTNEFKCFNQSKVNLAPTLYDLIVQLKSADVSKEALSSALTMVDGVLKNKLSDILKVFTLYQEYLQQNQLEDQSSILSYLPGIIEQDERFSNTEVYFIGYNSFTKQARDVVSAILKRAKKVTGIFVEGENKFVYTNETANIFKSLCKEQNISVNLTSVASPYTSQGEEIVKNIFNPIKNGKAINAQNIFVSAQKTPAEESEKIAQIIKSDIMLSNSRYKDWAVIIPQDNLYKDLIKKAFSLYDIPHFLDQKRTVENHPLVNFINSYIDVFRKGMSLSCILRFIKNPLISLDTKFVDEFENYLYKYNVKYERFLAPLIFEADTPEKTNEFDNFRQKICQYFSEFNVERALELSNAKQKIQEFSIKLKQLNETEESAVNDQVYDAVMQILNQIKLIIGNENLTYSEYKNIFTSGITALELSIIPQYNDAVFVGGFKEIALAQSKNLAVLGLTSKVPTVKEDVALLTDNDIDLLKQIKVLVEPQIKIVNHRTREETALGISSFKNQLYLSYPIADFNGTKNAKSEILGFIESCFTTKPFLDTDQYLTITSGKRNFAKSCGRLVEGKEQDFSPATTFYQTLKENFDKSHYNSASDIVSVANAEVKVKLDSNSQVLFKGITSATAIENFYSCPYKAFLSNGLKAYPREKGEVDGLCVGNVMHEVFKLFVQQIDKSTDKVSQENIFAKCWQEVISKKEYSKLLLDGKNNATLSFVCDECKDFCFNMAEWLAQSDFKAEKGQLEVGFGSGQDCKYPPILLCDGKVKLSGKIDRVDTYKNYCRVIDYKTGSADNEDKNLFSGRKLQLYLYGAAVNDKTLAGAYYLKVKGGYSNQNSPKKAVAHGKTFNQREVIFAQDNSIKENGDSKFLDVQYKGGDFKGAVSREQLDSYVKYALKVSQSAIEQLESGVIVASPYERACTYCEYLAICGKNSLLERKVNGVNAQTIMDSVNENAGEVINQDTPTNQIIKGEE